MKSENKFYLLHEMWGRMVTAGKRTDFIFDLISRNIRKESTKI
jgi:hypothetical protein